MDTDGEVVLSVQNNPTEPQNGQPLTFGVQSTVNQTFADQDEEPVDRSIIYEAVATHNNGQYIAQIQSRQQTKGLRCSKNKKSKDKQQIITQIHHSNAYRVDSKEYQRDALMRQIDNYKRENKMLKHRLVDEPQKKVQELQAELTDRDTQIQILKSEIKALKKINKFQQKGLVQAGGQDASMLFREKEKLVQENKRLMQKCEEMAREFRQKSNNNMKRLQDTPPRKSQQDALIVEEYARKIESLRNIESNFIRKVNQLQAEIGRLREQKAELQERLDMAEKQLEASNQRIVELRRKHIRTKTVDDTEIHQILHLPRMKTLQDHNISPPVVSPIQINNRAARKPSTKSQKHAKNFLTKSYKVTYPKVEERGQSQGGCIVWNDIQYSSKITEVMATFLNRNEEQKLGMLYFGYSRGENPLKKEIEEQLSTSNNLGDMSMQKFRCEDDEFVQLISGGFKNGVLEYIVLVTSLKRKVKWGRESTGCVKFDFNIGANEYPMSMYGQIQSEEQNRICKLGCFIEKISQQS